MSTFYIKAKKSDPKAIIPTKRDEDVGYDLYGLFKEPFVHLKPGDIRIIPTGLAIEFPKNFACILKERSSTGTKGMAIRAGVMDSGYRGVYDITLNNTSNKHLILYNTKTSKEELSAFINQKSLTEKYVHTYPQDKALCQMVFYHIAPHYPIQETDSLEGSLREDGKEGSTDK